MDTPVRVIGMPMDLGANRRGVDMGPSAVRYAGLAETLSDIDVTCTDVGDIDVPRPEKLPAEESATDSSDHDSSAPSFMDETRTVVTRLATEVHRCHEEGEFPLVLGGDHSIAMGSVAGWGNTTDDSLGIVWFDAHGDFNTPETSPSGNVHGMPLAGILGLGSFEDSWACVPQVSPENVALVGLRDIDGEEARAIQESPVSAYTMSDIDERGISTVVEEAFGVATEDTDDLHVSLDMDWLDPREAPGVGTPVRGGVSYREAHDAMEHVAHHHHSLCSFELVEVNPILDDGNATAELGCELIASAFGRRTL